jgi:hypothetical protein
MSRILMSFAAVAAVILGLASPALAQNDLERILERDKIAAQKLQADVTGALSRSRTLEKTEPGRAADLLQETLTKVRNSTELPAEERTQLASRLQTRIREVAAVIQQRARADEDAVRLAQQKLNQEGREQPAAGAKNATPAPGPAGIASKVFEQRNAALSAYDRNKLERAAKNQEVLTNLQKSATGTTSVYELPKDWDRISERGKQKLSAKEVALLKALNSTMSVNFDKAKLSEVINQLQDKSGLTILIDESSLKDANPPVDLYEETVNLKVSKVTVRTILRKILADRGLAYVIKDAMVQVVTQQKAREMMTVRSYPVSDLVAADNPLFWGPIFSRAIMLQNAQRIIDMIVSSIEPAQWNTNGGPGSITFHEPSMSLVIRASAEMHYQLGGSGMVSR